MDSVLASLDPKRNTEVTKKDIPDLRWIYRPGFWVTLFSNRNPEGHKKAIPESRGISGQGFGITWAPKEIQEGPKRPSPNPVGFRDKIFESIDPKRNPQGPKKAFPECEWISG
jgi:hypothetical protein